MKITFRQLQVFDAAATLGSVVRAAEKIGMSQSAASIALRDLQIVLQYPLFNHVKGQSLKLTKEGHRLKPLIRSLLTMANYVENYPEDVMQGTLLVGATDLIGETILPEICASFMKLYPSVKIKIQMGGFGEVLTSLQRMELDTALFEYSPDDPEIELISWRTEELWLVAAPDHPLAGRRDLKISDLAHVSWCARDAKSSTSLRLKAMFSINQQPASIEAASDHAVRLATIAGAGIACLSSGLIEADIVAGKLVKLDVEGFKFPRTLSLARPKGVWRSPLVKAFDAFLLERGTVPPVKP